MPIPDFIAALRAKIGHDPLWLPGVTAVVLRRLDHDTEVLLVRQVPTGQWTLVGGCIEPGEEPDTAAIREVREETGITIELDRLLSIRALPQGTLHNQDVVQFLNHAFVGHPVGDDQPAVGDDESDAVAWVPVDALPPLLNHHQRLVEVALDSSSVSFGVEERVLG
ncbi:NUDIX hydrolase [Brachybacterium paraconglomeratum]|uniref:NUDIX hydrolase n=1 Tax=Brachybacterium paraconglomeratum TaxID=173362 RepID=UPI003FD3880D